MPIDPITGAFIASAGADTLSSVIGGIGTARAGNLAFSEEEEREMNRLERLRRAGELGLTEKQRSEMEQRALQARAGAARQTQARQLQQQASSRMSGPISGRDIFLQEQAATAADLGARQAQNQALQQAEQQAEAIQLARLRDLQGQAEAEDIARVEGITQALGGTVEGVGEAGATAFQQQAELELAEARLGNQSDEALMNTYQQGQPGTANPYSSFV